MATTLNVCSFNCKNIKTSVTELNDLCTNHDFVLLQETWLSRPELPMLSQINSSFTGYGLSSMDEESQILSGRPFGGIAILWRKCFNAYCSIKLYDCDRIIGIEFAYDSFKALFLCVYLPYDCAENFDDYMFYLSQLLQIIEDFSSPYVYICGDFNANVLSHSRFGDELRRLCSDTLLCLSDTLLLPSDTFTFISSSHDTVSWLDHVLSTTSGHSLFTNISVKSDFITSDHLPLCFSISIDNMHVPIIPADSTSRDSLISYNWYGASDVNLSDYNSCTRAELAKIKLPFDALQCENVDCTSHRKDIDLFYYNIINTLINCTKRCIPVLKLHENNYIAGWNEHVSYYYNISRIEFKWWVSNNRPRQGSIYHAMRSSRARFKYALRQCKLDERLIVSEKLADHMKNHEINDFWKDIRKHSKSKSALSNCIDGVTGENAIADLWRDHYESLLNDSTHHYEKADVLQSFNNICSHAGMYVTMSEVLEVVKDLPNRKSSGLDGLNGESLKYADPLLCLLLSICYTCMFKHSYMPQSMINSIIVPLVKNRCGNLTDKNNYRLIALSSITSKVFEHIILLRLEEYLWTTDNQFGFKSGHSTDLCIYALSELIEYFKSRSTSVYVAFLDASKAFDKISHWTLFRKLIDRNVPMYLIKILCYWYQHQLMSVRWGYSISNVFNVTNGVRQGGILSPKLFNIYIDGLSNILNNSLIGGSLGGKRINHMLYADDLCIVSLSSAGLQKLLSICDEYCASHSITFNVKKSVCMFFKCSVNKHCDNSTVFLSGNQINFVQEVKYLGVLLNPSMKTSIDVSRQTRKFYAQANMLLRNFRYCSNEVKCSLFKSFCTNMYCCPLWFNSTSSSVKKLKCSYNSVLRRLLCIRMPYSASAMFVTHGIPSFYELLRKCIYNFSERISSSSNSIIMACLSPIIFIFSPIRRWWRSVLF